MHFRFNLKTFLLAICLVAWLISLAQPGGIYVHLPIGFGLLLLISVLGAAVSLYRSASEAKQRRKRWWQLEVSAGLFVLLLVAYQPLWPFALGRYQLAQSGVEQQRFVLHKMNPHKIRDVGRRFLARINTLPRQERVVFPNHEIVPDEIKSLNPRAIDVHPERLTLLLGNRSNRYYLNIYTGGAKGQGTIRLAPGVWYVRPERRPWITDSEWDDGVRR